MIVVNFKVNFSIFSDQQPHAEERTIVINSSGDLNLGKAPRQAYPLVVFLIKADCENENLDDTVSICFWGTFEYYGTSRTCIQSLA